MAGVENTDEGAPSREKETSGAWCCQTKLRFDTYALEPFLSPSGDIALPAKGIFAFHHVGEKLIGLFGRLSVAPPPDSESTGEQPGQTAHDDSHFIAHDDSLVQRHVVSKVHGAMPPTVARRGSLTLWNCGFYLFR